MTFDVFRPTNLDIYTNKAEKIHKYNQIKVLTGKIIVIKYNYMLLTIVLSFLRIKKIL